MKNQINYNVTGSDRQRMVAIISKELDARPAYTRMPECAYIINGVKVTKEGALEWDENTGNETIRRLADALAEAGFDAEEEISFTEEPETEPYTGEDLTREEMDGLTISMPLDGFNPDSLDRLTKLVDSKASLIKKSVGAACLTIHLGDDKVEFPWWGRLPSPEETQAYMAFIAALCAKAKESIRVNAKEREVESEKFAFRVFLLSLGFIGSEYKQVRNTLMKNLSGSAAFPTRAAADEFSAKQKAKRAEVKAETGEVAEA
ncbi:MAG: virulence protein [Oscillospiraceae bacterium]|nr:virulence protein [Oscillospiraceae bacterium]